MNAWIDGYMTGWICQAQINPYSGTRKFLSLDSVKARQNPADVLNLCTDDLRLTQTGDSRLTTLSFQNILCQFTRPKNNL